ncbi:MAG TPA: hypothetical protein VNV60_05830 [Holophagaceae bacterium]|jgi:hypothetical protein|nr:hypothetical protein [Holophagaceae bacterium]
MPTRMIRTAPVLALGVAIGVTALFVPACRPKSTAPPWILAAPGGSQMAVSGRLGWLAQDPSFRKLLGQSPEAEQALEIFLQRAHIDPAKDQGRLTLHLLDAPDETKPTRGFLLALDQFQDPKALQMALASSFPPEGTLHWNGKDCPLHVILDVDSPKLKTHLRALGDPDGRIWIGDLDTLAKVASGAFGPSMGLAKAAAWITPQAPLQGFLQPEALLQTWRKQIQDELPVDLPKGIAYLVWSVTPPADAGKPYEFELALSGEEAGIAQAAPWMQRLAAVAGSVQNGQAPPPEIQSGKDWVSLRMRLTGPQVEQVLGKLGQSFKSLHGLEAPKA